LAGRSRFYSERYFDFPALPVQQSDLILVGIVERAEGHLSENKSNVFSEFSIVVETVYKNTPKQITHGSSLTVERIGGFVKYPNGRKLLFQIAGLNMPKVGSRYLFFLTSKNKQDFSILTAYEFDDNAVIALDESPQLLAEEKLSEKEFIQQLRNTLQTSSN
jgi:hypothetical protein